MTINSEIFGVNSIDDLLPLFEKESYVADNETIMSVFLALKLQRPLLVEGAPGCGKTELAKVLARSFGTELIRMQCYEGLDVNSSIYEWDYLRQLLTIKMEEGKKAPSELEPEIFGERFLLKRPLLKAVQYQGPKPPVLLIDELDRADEEFEGFLLEFLGEFQLSIPELGTFRAVQPPVVVITSNNTRDLSEGLRRRCLYLYLSYPSMQKELKILKLKIPNVEDKFASQLVRLVSKLRSNEEIGKKPGIAETLDWASALMTLGKRELDVETVEKTIHCAIKNSRDLTLLKNDKLQSMVLSVLDEQRKGE